MTRPHHEDSRFRYCTNFIVTGEELEPRSFVSALEELGDSVLVVGDEATLKVHVHTDEPETAVAVFDRAGTVQRLDVADMREQIAERRERLETKPTGVVAVAAGEGMQALYEGLGAHVIDAGETFNPSTYELLAGIHEVPAEEVLVLPNSPNVIMAAERAAELSERPARVVDCTTPQGGLVALVELAPELPAVQNAERLAEALAAIKTGAVAPAARDDQQGRFVRGDAVGFVDAEIVAWGGAGTTLAETANALGGEAELLTVIGGRDAPIPLDGVSTHLPNGPEIELQDGGQPHYWWLLAAQ
jgi:dihydroxyacetone kinase-like predicted kinase